MNPKIPPANRQVRFILEPQDAPQSDPREIPDNWVVYFGPYKNRTYGAVKKLNPLYADNLTRILAGPSFDIFFL